jgi:hypothetical protein
MWQSFRVQRKKQHIESSRGFAVSGIYWESLNGALTDKGKVV